MVLSSPLLIAQTIICVFWTVYRTNWAHSHISTVSRHLNEANLCHSNQHILKNVYFLPFFLNIESKFIRLFNFESTAFRIQTFFCIQSRNALNIFSPFVLLITALRQQHHFSAIASASGEAKAVVIATETIGSGTNIAISFAQRWHPIDTQHPTNHFVRAQVMYDININICVFACHLQNMLFIST